MQWLPSNSKTFAIAVLIAIAPCGVSATTTVAPKAGGFEVTVGAASKGLKTTYATFSSKADAENAGKFLNNMENAAAKRDRVAYNHAVNNLKALIEILQRKRAAAWNEWSPVWDEIKKSVQTDMVRGPVVGDYNNLNTKEDRDRFTKARDEHQQVFERLVRERIEKDKKAKSLEAAFARASSDATGAGVLASEYVEAFWRAGAPAILAEVCDDKEPRVCTLDGPGFYYLDKDGKQTAEQPGSAKQAESKIETPTFQTKEVFKRADEGTNKGPTTPLDGTGTNTQGEVPQIGTPSLSNVETTPGGTPQFSGGDKIKQKLEVAIKDRQVLQDELKRAEEKVDRIGAQGTYEAKKLDDLKNSGTASLDAIQTQANKVTVAYDLEVQAKNAVSAIEFKLKLVHNNIADLNAGKDPDIGSNKAAYYGYKQYGLTPQTGSANLGGTQKPETGQSKTGNQQGKQPWGTGAVPGVDQAAKDIYDAYKGYDTGEKGIDTKVQKPTIGTAKTDSKVEEPKLPVKEVFGPGATGSGKTKTATPSDKTGKPTSLGPTTPLGGTGVSSNVNAVIDSMVGSPAFSVPGGGSSTMMPGGGSTMPAGAPTTMKGGGSTMPAGTQTAVTGAPSTVSTTPSAVSSGKPVTGSPAAAPKTGTAAAPTAGKAAAMNNASSGMNTSSGTTITSAGGGAAPRRVINTKVGKPTISGGGQSGGAFGGMGDHRF